MFALGEREHVLLLVLHHIAADGWSLSVLLRDLAQSYEARRAGHAPRLAELPAPLIVNVMGFTRAQVAELVTAFSAREEVAALELNVSCPNVKAGGVTIADGVQFKGNVDMDM